MFFSAGLFLLTPKTIADWEYWNKLPPDFTSMISLPSSVYSFFTLQTTFFNLQTPYAHKLIPKHVSSLSFFCLPTSLDSAVLQSQGTTLWSSNAPWSPCFLLISCFSPAWGNPSFSSVCKQIFSGNSLAKLDVPFSGFHILSMCFCQRSQSFVWLLFVYISLLVVWKIF